MKDAQKLQDHFPAIIRCRLDVSRADGGLVAHIDVLLPEHQVILNRAHADRDAAVRAALDAANEQLALIARRDPQHFLKAA
jgi:hypothetical protein